MSCRAGAALHAPSVCSQAVISADEAADLCVSAKWCRPHAEALSRVKNRKTERTSIKSITTAGESAYGTRPALPPRRTVKEYANDRAEEARRRHRDLADRITAYVIAADRHPVSSGELVGALDASASAINRAAKLVNDARVERRAGRHGGWYLREGDGGVSRRGCR
ncbi:MAG: hypothetical protein JWQ20_2680 [Conexibacter sp.]|nr:hypothetical protein [Conexibacter sp.]